jgi:hypothetical protein
MRASHDPLTLLGVAAAVTSHVLLGTSTINSLGRPLHRTPSPPTFIVATDDVDVLTRFADETAPQVRRDVDAGRPDQGTEIHTGQRTDQGEQQS